MTQGRYYYEVTIGKGMKSMFQRRHYKAVAEALREAKRSGLVTATEHTLVAWMGTVETIDYMFHRDNPRFNSDKFRGMAGYERID